MLESPKIPSSADLFSVDELQVLDKVGLLYSSAREVRYARSLLDRFRMNSAILKNKYLYLPVDNAGHEDFVPVGRLLPSSPWCGVYTSILVCDHMELHEGKFVGDEDCSGKVVVKPQHMFCNRAGCPICFDRGHATREARAIEVRLNKGVELGFGKPEHVTVSVAVADRELPERVFREKCRMALLDRGVIGGEMTFHGYRIDRVRNVLHWSPHYHCLGFIKHGFDECRECVHDRGDCASCDGFKGREVRGYAKDGYLVKVLGIRKTVFGTAKYALNHATIKVGIRRFQSVTWFGICGYRKYQSGKVKAEVKCPACDSVMVKKVYVGKRHIVKDLGSPDYLPVFLDDEFGTSGKPNYVDAVGGRFG
jgi:hypothetical protein